MSAKKKGANIGGVLLGVLGIVATLTGLVTFLIIDAPEIQQRIRGGDGVEPTDDTFLLTNNFNNGLGGGWQVLEGDWQVENGMLLPSSTLTSTIMGGEATWTNYKVVVDVVDAAGRGQYAAAVLVRMQDASNYVALVTERGCSKVHWEVVSGGVPLPQRDTNITCKSPFRVEITVEGNVYTAIVGGTSVALEDATFSSGAIGLQSRQGSEPAGFDTLRITLLD